MKHERAGNLRLECGADGGRRALAADRSQNLALARTTGQIRNSWTAASGGALPAVLDAVGHAPRFQPQLANLECTSGWDSAQHD
jgi:hypothetical protein